MAVAKQDRFSSLVDVKLRDSIVQKIGAVWNNRYEGSPKAGAVKVPVRDTEVAVSAYVQATGATMTDAAGSFITVTIDKDYAVNEKIDGYEVDSVPDNILADRLDSAGYSLALQMNSDATAELVSGGTTIQKSGSDDTTALTKSNVYEYIVDARTALSKSKVPTAGRFLLVSPDVYSVLLKSPEFIKASQLGDAVTLTGAVGQISGFTVFEDTTLPAKVDFIAGHPDWCCRVEEWAVEPHVQDLNGSGTFIGAVAVQGRKIYAHKVTKAAAVLVKVNQ